MYNESLWSSVFGVDLCVYVRLFCACLCRVSQPTHNRVNRHIASSHCAAPEPTKHTPPHTAIHYTPNSQAFETHEYEYNIHMQHSMFKLISLSRAAMTTKRCSSEGCFFFQRNFAEFVQTAGDVVGGERDVQRNDDDEWGEDGIYGSHSHIPPAVPTNNHHHQITPTKEDDTARRRRRHDHAITIHHITNITHNKLYNIVYGLRRQRQRRRRC